MKRILNTTPLAALLLAIAVLIGACGTEARDSVSQVTSSAVVPAALESVAEVAPRIYGNVEKAVVDENARSSVELPPVSGVEYATVTYAPEVPPVITRNHATKVIVDLEVTEVVKELADGVQYTFWTFGDEVPGPMIRVREGDLVELTMKNHPDNQLPHNIDLHSVTGTGGGAEATLVVPGKEATFSFRATTPGLYVYHCATAPVGLHVANGMYGMIVVDPKEGLPPVDREYYVMQSEFYTVGGFKEKGLQEFSLDKALAENPDYVVFNGGVDALTGPRALQAAVGETVRIYFGNAGPNLTSSFHVIGEIFDRVYGEAGSQVTQTNVQTTSIPAGGATIVEFEVDVPGRYTLVDHAIFRAFNKGAIGTLDVVGPKNTDIFSERIRVQDYVPPSVTAARQ